MESKVTRRKFLGMSTMIAGTGFFMPDKLFNINKGVANDEILGHGSHRYKKVANWGILDNNKNPVKDCHEMVQDAKGRIILLTNETRNNIIIYNKSGKLLRTWGDAYPGGHGLTLASENGQQFLFISDNNRHEVIKTDLEGNVILTVGYPKDFPEGYQSKEQYIPTEVAVAPNGDFYVADGYGQQYVIHYNYKGEFIRAFGGKGEGDSNLNNAHGICVDTRDKNNPILLVTSREDNKVKRFSMDGKYLSTLHFPGSWICRPVQDDENIYFATLKTKMNDEMKPGFVVILDKNNKVISNPGGSGPIYEGEKLKPMQQTEKLFIYPHDVCVDDDKSLYVAQWNSGKTYPIKLERVS